MSYLTGKLGKLRSFDRQ